MRLLVVEDDVDVMKLLTIALHKRGHHVLPLDDGTEVFAHAIGTHGPPPDAIILDFHLPKMSGDRVLQALATDAGARSIPVIIYSALPHLALTAAIGHRSASFVQKGRLRELFAELDRLESTLVLPEPHPVTGDATL